MNWVAHTIARPAEPDAKSLVLLSNSSRMLLSHGGCHISIGSSCRAIPGPHVVFRVAVQYASSAGRTVLPNTMRRTSVQLQTGHLGLSRDERQLQVDELLGPLWLAHRACRPPVILCSDFNATPFSTCYAHICQTLADAQRSLKDHRPHTWHPICTPTGKACAAGRPFCWEMETTIHFSLPPARGTEYATTGRLAKLRGETAARE